MKQHSAEDRVKAAEKFAAVPLQVDVELDNLAMTLRDLLSLGEGMILKTNKRVGDALDVSIGGASVAQGEVVKGADRATVRLKGSKKS